jgi:hypothetical protein
MIKIRSDFQEIIRGTEAALFDNPHRCGRRTYRWT